MTTVHWLGAGLSTWPGIRRISNSGTPLIVWNRTLERAEHALGDTQGLIRGTANARLLDKDLLAKSITPGDIIVSMLPGDFHVPMATLALEKGAHFVSSSYLSPEMKALDAPYRKAGLVNVNETGLDPGIDHLFAHRLVNAYRASDIYAPGQAVSFRSYCGGVPAIPNAFKYKFSWSPLGVLKALKSRAQWIHDGDVQSINTPWKAVTRYTAEIANGGKEVFEAYPNRDSLPFMEDYGFDDSWTIQEFVRGTLRLDGWTDAWDSLFDQIETMSDEDATAKLTAISERLWEQHQYDEGEADRVVLCVELEVRDPDSNEVLWHQSYNLDETGVEPTTAMAVLVSVTVSLAVDAVIQGRLTPGVMPAPSDPALVSDWLAALEDHDVTINHVNHLLSA